MNDLKFILVNHRNYEIFNDSLSRLIDDLNMFYAGNFSYKEMGEIEIIKWVDGISNIDFLIQCRFHKDCLNKYDEIFPDIFDFKSINIRDIDMIPLKHYFISLNKLAKEIRDIDCTIKLNEKMEIYIKLEPDS